MALAAGKARSQTPGILFVQGNWASQPAISSTVAVPFAAVQVAGDLNIVVVTWNDASAQVQTVLDTTGNSYQRAVGPTVRSSSVSQSLYYAANKATAAAGANTVTVTFTAGATTPEVRVAEYSGIDPLQPLDVAAGASGNSTSSSSGSATTRNANDLLVGANWASGVTTAAGATFTSRMITSSGDVLEDRVVTTTGSYLATAPVSPSGPWIMQLAAFRAAGSPQPDLTVTKTHTGSFTQGQTGATYTLTVRNSGAWSTAGTVTVVDTLPSGLTATALSGSGWTCTLSNLTCTRSSVLAAGSTYPAITLTVSVAATAPASVTNSVTVSGGGETNTANDAAADVTTINASVPDLTLTKTHNGSFTQGQIGARYTLTARNSGTGSTSGVVTVRDTLPAGLTATALSGNGWSCTLSTLTCTRSSTLAGGSSYSAITLTVNVAANAAAAVTNTATVAGGSETNTANDAASDVTAITQLADLTLTKTHAGSFKQGQSGAVYSLTVANTGGGPTNGTVTVSDALPAGLTATSIGGTGWTCTQPAGPCTRSDVLAAGNAYPTVALTVNVASNAAASVTNTATVAGGGEAVTSNDTASDVTVVASAAPDLALAKTHVGAFAQGQSGATYVLTVSNVGLGPTGGTVTVGDSVPAGLIATSMSGAGWSCTEPAGPCQRTDSLAAGAAYPSITLTANVAGNAPPNITNTATVTIAGDINTANNTATDIAAVTQLPDLTVSASHAGAFTQGQTGAIYTITISNVGSGAGSGVVTVTDSLPPGLTATTLGGAGWSCLVATLTCTRGDAIAAGAVYPVMTLTVDVDSAAAPSVTNMVSVAGGGEINAANDTALDPTTIVVVPDLVVTSTHAGSFAQGQTGAKYVLTVRNAGATSTSDAVTVADVLPAGLTASALSGTGWICDIGALTCTRHDLLAPGAVFPVIDLVVDVAGDALASLVNVATVGGGGEFNTANDSADDVTTVTGPSDLVVSSSHVGSFVLGQPGATYILTVSNPGAGYASGIVTVTDVLPPGLTATSFTGSGWTCVVETLSCTRSDGLAAGAAFPTLTLTVTVGQDAGATVTNTVVVSGGGEANTDNDTATDATTIVPPPDLRLTKTHVDPFAQGQAGAVYTLVVTNAGGGPTVGAVTVTDALPAGLTATGLAGVGWSCAPATLSCTRNDILAAGTSYPAITVTVDVSTSAPASVINTAAVSGGGDANTANNIASDATAIALLPDLAFSLAHGGTVTQGQAGASYSLTVTNVGAGPTVGVVTVVDTLPAGLTATAFQGLGWSCAVASLSCTRSDALAAGSSYPAITLTVDVAATASASVTNTGTVSGGGETNIGNDTAADVTPIVQLPDLALAATHSGSFIQGQSGASYTLIVTNTGPGPTTSPVTVADTLPIGLTATAVSGAGWACTLGTLTCTRNDVLTSGASYPAIALTVNVAPDAPVNVTNTAVLSGGGEINTANDTASDATAIVQPPDLIVASAHAGSFTQGQSGAVYTLTATNAGGGPTAGGVTVADTLPGGLTATGMTGAGWSCALGSVTCTRSDVLAAGAAYPPITLTIDVAGNAGASITNTATVSGGGDISPGNNTTTDPTAIVQLPDLIVSATHGGGFAQGQTGASYTLTITNAGAGPTTAAVTVADTLPNGLTATAFDGAGWTCTLATLTCTRGDVLSPGANYPALTLTVNVSVNAAASVTNTVTVGGGGETATSNDAANDITIIAQLPDLIVASTHNGPFVQGQSGATYALIVSNGGPGPTADDVIVTDALPRGLTATAISGAGWSCQLNSLTCSRSDVLASGSSYPQIALAVAVAADAPTSVTNAVAVSGGGETNTANDMASDVTTIAPATAPPVFVTEAHFAVDQNTSGLNRATLSLNASGTNTVLLAALHVEFDGGDTNWVATDNGVQGTLLLKTDGYTGGAGNRRFQIFYWMNPPAGTNSIVIQNTYTGSNEITASAVLLKNVSQTGPLGAITLDVSPTGRTSESETVAAAASDLVLHVIADALLIRGTLGAGETSVSVANDGLQKLNAGDGDASLWISTKPGTSSTTTVSSVGWPSGPSPSPRPLNAVAIVLHGAGPDLEAPTAPGSLVATGISGSQVRLTWTASTDNVGVTGYRIERCQGAGCTGFGEIAAPSGTGTTFSDSAVAVGATYSYRMRATDAFGNLSTYSNTSSATVPTPDMQPPSAPGFLAATAVNGSHVNLTWGAATDDVGVMDYRVQRCDGACTTTGFVRIGTVAATTFSDSGLTPSTTYSYIVSAEDTSNNLGPSSNVSIVTTLATLPELVAAYSFDEGTGTTVSDASGNSRTGTIANATWTTSGKYGKALSFNGTSAKVRIPDDPGLRLSTAMTLEAWVNPSTVTSAWRDVIYKGNDNYFLMGTTTQSGRPSVGGTFAGTNFNNYGPSTLPLNTWSHLAATYDGAMLRLYVNGSQLASAARTGVMTASTNPLEIGGDSIFGQYFKGLIDEVRVYSIALTPTQIQTDMAAAISAASPVAAINPTTLNFGSQATGTTSVGQSVTITNSGTAALVISSISLTGANPADFGKTNTCVTTLAPGVNCTVTMTFTPAATGTRAAALTVADNAAGSPHFVPLSGIGTGFSITPRVSVLTPTLNQQFGVTGGGNLTWSVDGVVGGDDTKGTITPTGLYTPPSTAGTYTVSVTTDQLQTSSAAVYVTTYGGTFTHHNDNLRTGQNLSETVLKPSNVNSATFGKLFSYSLDGLSIASPLYVAGVTIPGQGVHNVVYVATEHDSVYAMDADGTSTAPLWQRSFLGSGVTTVPAADTGECCDISPEIGITGTPVIDPFTKTLYVVAKTKEGPSTYVQRLHALDLGTGAEKFGGPVVIEASVPGHGNGSSGGQVSFDPLHQNQRPSLLLNNGVVYVGFGSHGDQQPYHGWLLGYHAGTLQPVMALNVTPNAAGGGLWQANGGPAADAAGNIYVITGNGAFDANTGGSDFGDSFLKVTPSGTIADYFTPWNQGALNANNFDLGAAGPLLLPDQPGAHPHLMVSAGKNNTIYLVDRDAMGHYSGTTSDNQIVQSLINIFPFGTPEPGNYSAPVYFNGTVYFGPIADSIQAFPLTNGLLRTTALTRSADVFKYPGATLAISAAGTSNGILWAIQRNGDCGVQPSCGTAAPGVFKAYDASNLGTLLYSSDQMGARDMFDFATKFSVPLVANGKVFVGSLGQLTVYGLLP